MYTCSICRKEVKIDRYLSRKSTCPVCGADLHICLNCKFYSETAHNKCVETKAEFQRTRDKANFCEYFAFSEISIPVSVSEKEDALKKLNDLFRNQH